MEILFFYVLDNKENNEYTYVIFMEELIWKRI